MMTGNSTLVGDSPRQEGAHLFCQIVESLGLTQEAADCAAAFSIWFE